jgi:hypothetical protein
MLAELERIRELTLDLIERETPRLLPAPPVRPRDGADGVRLLLALRGSGNPAAAGAARPAGAEGAATQTPRGGRGCATRWSPPKQWNLPTRLGDSELNVLRRPAPNAGPDAWADLLADAVIGHGLDDSILAYLRPEGFA